MHSIKYGVNFGANVARICYTAIMYKPKFSITPLINNQIAQIEAIRQKIDRANILPTQEIALRYKAAIESTHSSTSIEGNPLNPNQVQKALEGKMNAWEKRVIEVVNYKKAWDWIVKRSKKPTAITIQDIFHIHSLVMKNLLPPEKIGQIRPSSIYIVDIIKGEEIVKYRGPGQKKVASLLEDLLVWIKLNQQFLHPVLLAGILHYEFVSIHPFSDGNGRVTRLLVKLLLDSFKYDFRGSLVLDTYYWQNTSLYYQSLNQASTYTLQTKSDLNPWLIYFVTGFAAIVQELDHKINLIHSLGHINTLRLTENEMEIIDYIQQFGDIGLQDALSILRKPSRSIQRILQFLVKKGVLIKTARGKNTRYSLVR